MNGAISFQSLREEVLGTIQRISTDTLSRDAVLLLGPVDVEAILGSWNKVQRHMASAKLAIVREEFAARFPSLSKETEDFSFGINDPISDRYMEFLKPREPTDITNLVMQLLDDVYPPAGPFRKRRIQGLVPLAVKLTKVLTVYAQGVEALMQPYAEAFGIRR